MGLVIKKQKLGKLVHKALFYVAITAMLTPFMFVFFWMLSGAFKSQVENIAYPPVFFPPRPTWENYISVFTENPFLRFFINSLTIASGSTIIGLVLGLPAAYSIARYHQTKLGIATLLVRMTPGISFCIPLYILFTKVGLVDTYLGLITVHLIITLPFIIWVMVGFFEELPLELEDAALIDGCSKVRVFSAIALPLVKSGMATASILAFIFSWNYFMFSLVLSMSKTKMLPVAVFNYMSYEAINWGGLYAAATIIVLPVLILALLVQRHIVRGLTFGALKG